MKSVPDVASKRVVAEKISTHGRAGGRSAGCRLEPLEERLLMALSRAGGGSGYSGTVYASKPLTQQQLIMDPAEPAAGSTSLLYDASKVSLQAFVPGPGYNNQAFSGVVEVENNGQRRLQSLVSFLDSPAGRETGYAQVRYQLDTGGQAGQIPGPRDWDLLDEAGVEGVDTHAFRFAMRPGVPVEVEMRYVVFAATAGSHSGNQEDFLIVNDGTGKRLGPADLAPAIVNTRPTDGSIYGTAYHDADADGTFDAGEAPIEGAQVYLDLDGDRTFDDNEPRQLTDEEGHYLFDDLTPGRYLVGQVTPAGYLAPPTQPANGVHAVTVVAGRRERGVDFGNVRPGVAAGVVFTDLNGNGVRERNEAGLAGVVVYADLDRDGTRDANESSDTSARGGIFESAGAWSIGGLRPGTYVIRQVTPSDYAQTAPAQLFHVADVYSGATTGGLSFGNYMAPPRVTGAYFSGASWSTDFKNFLAAAGLGDPAAGVLINPAAPRYDVPWVDPNRVSVRFDKPVLVESADLSARSLDGRRTYAFSGFNYDELTRTATWTLERPILAERLVLDLNADAGGVTNVHGLPLDGEWSAAAAPRYPTGNGAAGGDFRLGVAVLGGDTTGDGVVNASDVADVKRRLTRSTTNPGSGLGAYTIFADINADTRINALDLAAVKARLTRRLPPIIILPPIDPFPIDPLPIEPVLVALRPPSESGPVPIPYPNVLSSIQSASVTRDLFADDFGIA